MKKQHIMIFICIVVVEYAGLWFADYQYKNPKPILYPAQPPIEFPTGPGSEKYRFDVEEPGGGYTTAAFVVENGVVRFLTEEEYRDLRVTISLERYASADRENIPQ